MYALHTLSLVTSKGALTYEEAQIRKDDPYVHGHHSCRTRVSPFDSGTQTMCVSIRPNSVQEIEGQAAWQLVEVKIHVDSSESSDPINVK
jgi:exosome complex exonuclease DIS3/RRP44